MVRYMQPANVPGHYLNWQGLTWVIQLLHRPTTDIPEEKQFLKGSRCRRANHYYPLLTQMTNGLLQILKKPRFRACMWDSLFPLRQMLSPANSSREKLKRYLLLPVPNFHYCQLI